MSLRSEGATTHHSRLPIESAGAPANKMNQALSLIFPLLITLGNAKPYGIKPAPSGGGGPGSHPLVLTETGAPVPFDLAMLSALGGHAQRQGPGAGGSSGLADDDIEKVLADIAAFAHYKYQGPDHPTAPEHPAPSSGSYGAGGYKSSSVMDDIAKPSYGKQAQTDHHSLHHHDHHDEKHDSLEGSYRPEAPSHPATGYGEKLHEDSYGGKHGSYDSYKEHDPEPHHDEHGSGYQSHHEEPSREHGSYDSHHKEHDPEPHHDEHGSGYQSHPEEPSREHGSYDSHHKEHDPEPHHDEHDSGYQSHHEEPSREHGSYDSHHKEHDPEPHHDEHDSGYKSHHEEPSREHGSYDSHHKEHDPEPHHDEHDSGYKSHHEEPSREHGSYDSHHKEHDFEYHSGGVPMEYPEYPQIPLGSSGLRKEVAGSYGPKKETPSGSYGESHKHGAGSYGR